MLPVSTLLFLVGLHLSEVRRGIREKGDRGSNIVETAIIVGLFAAAAIIIVGVLVAKAKTAADNVQTQ
jgi:hypothetical protein